jgi:hypothetical protein
VERRKLVSEMHNVSESRKYRLFPATDQLSSTNGKKSTELCGDSSLRRIETVTKAPKSTLNRKSKEQSITRRRKVSLPELGPMTTVQEASMDSRKSRLDQIPFLYK